MKISKILLIVFIAVLYFSGIKTFAQFAPIPMPIMCVDSRYDLQQGSRDMALFGPVMKLQLYLYKTGLMNYPPTAYFGPLTQGGVSRYQSMKGLYPSGIFDYNTRVMLAKETCSGTPGVPATSTAPVVSYPTTPTYPTAPVYTPTYPATSTYPTYPPQTPPTSSSNVYNVTETMLFPGVTY